MTAFIGQQASGVPVNSSGREVDVTMPNETPMHLAQKFETLMRDSFMVMPESTSLDKESVFVQYVESQDAGLKGAVDDLRYLMEVMPSMTSREFTLGTMRVSSELVSVQCDLTSKMALVNSSRSAIDTLMRNE